MRHALRHTGLAAAAVSLIVTMSACGSDDSGDDTAGSGTSSSEPPSTDEPMADGSGDATALVGPGCAGYAEQVPDGPGSVEGMAQDPVSTAASSNPLLKTLVKAVSGQLNMNVDLVNDLNSSEITVLAPVDSAFAKIDAKTLASLSEPSGADALSQILTYHVIPGRLAPEELVGKQATLEGEKVTVTGSPDALMIDGAASVICGNVQTANATVYLIDSVLMPPSLAQG